MTTGPDPDRPLEGNRRWLPLTLWSTAVAAAVGAWFQTRDTTYLFAAAGLAIMGFAARRAPLTLATRSRPAPDDVPPTSFAEWVLFAIGWALVVAALAVRWFG